VNYDLAAGPDPATARKLSAEGVKKAIEKLRAGGSFTTFKPKMPMTVTLKLKSTESADRAAKRPGVKRIDAYTVSAVLDKQCDVLKWFSGTGLDMKKD
jgi:D-aminopeptidase